MVLEQSERSGEVFAERCEGGDDGGWPSEKVAFKDE